MKIKLLLTIAAALVAGACLPMQAQNNGPVNAVSLDGVTGYVSVPNGVWFDGNFTVEGWVFVRSYASWSRLIDFGNGAPGDNVYLALTEGTTGRVNLGIYTNTTSSGLTTSTVLPTNQWVHLAATLSGTTATIYFNGISQGAGTLFVPRNVTRTNNYIGRSDFEIDGDAKANAEFDEIRIWNVARTQSQILADMDRSLAGTETGLIGYWRFDEGTGTTTADISGHGETATFEGGSSWVTSGAPLTAGPGQGLSLASCENVTIPNQAALNAYPITVMTWVNVPTNEPGGGGGAFVNKYTSASLNGWQIALGGQPYGWYYRDGSDNVGKIGVGAINDGLWHHLAYVVQASGGQIYLDGVLKQSVAWTGTAGACTTTNPVVLGIYPGDSCLLGSIDEVSIWNTALTATQIQTYMHRPLLGTEANLVAYYRLDEGAGTTTVDATGNGNNGTLESGPVWITSGAPVGAPQVTTLAATAVVGSSATLNASVGPEGQGSIAWFQWGVTNTYGNFTATNSLGDGFASVTNSIALTGLATGTYHYRAVSTNTGGTNFGEDMTFAISGTAPAVTNLAVSSLTATGAKLNATVNPEGTATTVYFIYGTTESYGTTNSAGSIGSGSAGVNVSDTLSGLTGGAVYHYEVVASNSIGVTYGGDQTFTTATFVAVNANLSGTDIYNTFEWGDFNNDGRLDLLFENEVEQNNGNGTFSAVSIGAPRIDLAAEAWGDFDNDGYLDALITGSDVLSENQDLIAQLWHNNGNGAFTLLNNTGLPGLQSAVAAVADFDNDGRQDVLLLGEAEYDSNPCGVWHNNGNGTFTQISIPGMANISQGGAAAAADFNNDGYMDFIVTGFETGIGGATQLWQNNGDGTFTQIPLPAELTQFDGAALAVGDFNNDGYPDFVISGFPYESGPATQLWINNGDGTFSQDTDVSLPGVYDGALACGDFDNDGYPDILISGSTGYNPSTGNPTNVITQVWRNQQDGTFTNINTSLQGLYSDSAVWGDYNNDGRLDIAEEGLQLNNQFEMFLYQNDTAVTNTPPTAPSGLQATPNGTGVVLSWNPATDAQTPASGLTYNIRVGSSPGGFDIVSPAANLASGFRRLAQAGNAQECLFAYVTNLHTGTYYWSVQAIDTAFAGSAFAPEAQFTQGLPNPPTVATLAATSVTNTTATLNGTVNPAGLTTTFFFQWGPDTNYGNSTPTADPGTGFAAVPESYTLTGLNPGETYHYQAEGTNIGGISFGADIVFTVPNAVPSISQESASIGVNPPTNVTLNAVVNANGTTTGAWFVYGATTNYGSMTATSILSGTNYYPVGVNILISNVTEGEVVHFQAIATNANGITYGGDTTFTVPSMTLIPYTLPSPPSGGWGASAAWGDFNNHGFLDAALENSVWSNNNGNGTFTQISIGLPGQLGAGTQTWGDLENTGYLDLLSTGDPGSVAEGNDEQLTELWHNNGNGTFTLMTNTGLPNLDQASVAFGDFDNDGKLDILLIGGTSEDDGVYACVSGIWHNNGNGTFTQTFGFGGLYGGGVAVGDFDNDGYLDFIAVGLDSSYGANSEVWRNNGDGTFSQMSVPGLVPLTYGSVAVGDFNNDGKSDFIISGANYVTPETQLWQNNGNWSFTQDTQAALPGLWQGQVAWGDYNNDGNIDLLFSGAAGDSFGLPASPTTQLWENLGNGNFTNSDISLFPLLYNGEAWGDYNNDGRLDILLTGFLNENTPQTWLIRNDALVTNTRPTAPTGLTSSANGYGVVLSWNASTDAQTPSAGLSYNIRVGSSSGGINIVAPQSDPVTGFRRLPQIGNAQQRRFSILTNLSAGTYYWSVQAVDSAFAGSAFAPEVHFSLPGPGAATGAAGQITSGSAVLNGTVTPNGNNTTVWFQWDTNANFTSNTVSILINGTNSGPVAVSLVATGLSSLTQYYYRMTASNIISQSYGSSSNFTTLAPVPPTINQIAAQPVNGFILNFTGESWVSYTLQESTNLTNWTVATNLTANSNGMFQFGGTNTGNYPAIYFRLSRP